MAALDETIHQSVRLKIMSALNTVSRNEALEFSRLKTITGATDGNLGAHLTTLETAGYIAVTKEFIGKKPRTSVSMTPTGRRAFENHVAYLREILDGVSTH